jgi:hypothetical protein
LPRRLQQADEDVQAGVLLAQALSRFAFHSNDLDAVVASDEVMLVLGQEVVTMIPFVACFSSITPASGAHRPLIPCSRRKLILLSARSD